MPSLGKLLVYKYLYDLIDPGQCLEGPGLLNYLQTQHHANLCAHLNRILRLLCKLAFTTVSLPRFISLIHVYTRQDY